VNIKLNTLASMIERLGKLIAKSSFRSGQPTSGWLKVVDAKRHPPATRKNAKEDLLNAAVT
jgi:hypothetical protein